MSVPLAGAKGETGLTWGGALESMVCARGFPEFLRQSARTRERKTGLIRSGLPDGAAATRENSHSARPVVHPQKNAREGGRAGKL